jgi:hypothetical protein
VVEDLAKHDRAASDAKSEEPSIDERKVVSLTSGEFGKPAFCVPGLGRLDECAVLVVADALRREGINARVTGATAAIESDEASSVCVCYVEECLESKDRLCRAEAFQEGAGGGDHRVPVVRHGRIGRGLSSASGRSARSLKATIDALTSPKRRIEASSGTNGISKGSTFK